MLEQFLPQVYSNNLCLTVAHAQFLQEIIDRPSATRAAKATEKNNADKELSTSIIPATGAWPQQVGIHRVVWNNGNGLGCSTLLASATASGLCRVDCLFGRWHRERISYGGIEAIRMEGKTIDDDEDVVVEDNNDEDGVADAEAEGESEDEDEEM